MSNVSSANKLLSNLRGHHQINWSDKALKLASIATMDSSKWTLGLLNSIDNPSLQSQIQYLGANQVQPNPFFELPILAAGQEYLRKGELQYLFLSEQVNGQEVLKLFAPVTTQKTKLMRRPVMRVWSHEYAPYSLPLIDSFDPSTTLDALTKCLLAQDTLTPMALWFDEIPTESKFFTHLFSQTALANRVLRFSATSRAAYNQTSNQTYNDVHVSGKRRQRNRVAQARLEEFGRVEYSVASTPDEVALALEKMLKIEKLGWKGKRGTALAQSKRLAKYTRASVSEMARAGKCEIYTLNIEKTTIASLIVFNSAGHYFAWKTAFDETYAPYSAGNLLISHVNQCLSLKDDFKSLDSLADPANQTANRFWPDQKKLCSLIIGLGKDGDVLASNVMEELRVQRKIKHIAKKILNR